MGFAMASNVRKRMSSSDTLHIYDINTSVCEKFKAELETIAGPIRICSGPMDVASRAATIISILPNGAIVKDVYLNTHSGVVAAKGQSAVDSRRLHLECSTIDIETTREVGTELSKAGMGYYVDSPVSVRIRFVLGS
jgi:3-hydroxyisobutyrate/3-hydroxypropionate dehydrogenase